MRYIYIGRFVNTHGLKGEIRIISDFEYKDSVFKEGNTLYIGNNKYTIKNYRKHKNYELVLFNEVSDINDIEKSKGEKVYIDREDYNFDYVLEDLIGFDIYDNKNNIGTVYEVVKSNLYPILKVKGNNNFMIPYISNFIKSIDKKKKKIEIYYMKGLYDEN